MYLSVNNIVFIILLYQCLTARISSVIAVYNDYEGCVIPIPRKYDFESPRPSPLKIAKPVIKITPKNKQNMYFKHNDQFKLSCIKGQHISVSKSLNKILVKCIEKESVLYDGIEYQYREIKCHDIIITNTTTNTNTTKAEEDPYAIAVTRNQADLQDCFIILPDPDYNYMPIPFLTNTTPAIIHPNRYGFFNIKAQDEFRLTCADSIFISPVTGVNELTVKCISKTFIEFNSRQYEFDRFRCKSSPRAKLVLTEQKCQYEGSRIAEVGFETISAFLIVYKICYDPMRNHPIYAWYHVYSPLYKLRQVSTVKPNYIRTQSYSKIDMEKVYWNQDLTVKQILSSRKRSEELIIRGEKRYVTKTHLMAKSEFYYSFEKMSTYFYENTVPQWYRCSRGAWRDVERVFRRYLSISKSKHVVVSGSFMTSTLPDSNGVPHPFYLTVTRQIPVPQYLWKMNYDVNTNDGVVWVGLNNPTTRFNETKYICKPIVCPAKMQRKTYHPKFMYCCTKNDFEKSFGRLDPIVYNEFNVIRPHA